MSFARLRFLCSIICRLNHQGDGSGRHIIDFQSRALNITHPGDDREPDDVLREDMTLRIALRGVQQIVRRALEAGNTIGRADKANFVYYVKCLAIDD